MKKSVLLIGATGLVGRQCLDYLLADERISEVRIIVRRETEVVHEKLKELVIDFERLPEFKAFMHADVFISCFGSTMKKAGSEENFIRMDLDYPAMVAQISKENGTKKMILVSALDVTPDSTFFYNRVKAQLEEKVSAMGFEELAILRPSIILGNAERPGNTPKIIQGLMKAIDPLLLGSWRKYKAISYKYIARAAAELSLVEKPGKVILEYDEIAAFSNNSK